MAEPDPRWQRVGERITARMNARGWGAEAIHDRGGPTYKSVVRYAEGFPITQKKNIPLMCAALGWTPESIQLILDGGEPVELNEDAPPSRVDVLEQAVADLDRRLRLLEGPQGGEVVPMVRPKKPAPPPPPAEPARRAAKKRPPKPK